MSTEKTPEQIAEETVKNYPLGVESPEERAYLVEWIRLGIEADRAQPEGAEWEYGRQYFNEEGDVRIRKTDDIKTPDGYRADGTPYWNYSAVRRRKAGPWEVVE